METGRLEESTVRAGHGLTTGWRRTGNVGFLRCPALRIGSFSLWEKVRMRETRSKKSFFHPLTLASSDYAKDKLSRRERELRHPRQLKL